MAIHFFPKGYLPSGKNLTGLGNYYFRNLFSKHMQAFIKKLSIFSITIAIMVFLWNHIASEKFYVRDIWFAYSFFIAATLLVHMRMIEAGKKRPGLFVRNFMAVTVIKFFVYLVIIIAYCLLKPAGAANFSAAFLLLYFLFSAFEVAALRTHFKG